MLTAGNKSKSFDMIYPVKCRRDEFFGNKKVKRGKPRELETQNW